MLPSSWAGLHGGHSPGTPVPTGAQGHPSAPNSCSAAPREFLGTDVAATSAHRPALPARAAAAPPLVSANLPVERQPRGNAARNFTLISALDAFLKVFYLT